MFNKKTCFETHFHVPKSSLNQSYPIQAKRNKNHFELFKLLAITHCSLTFFSGSGLYFLEFLTNLCYHIQYKQ